MVSEKSWHDAHAYGRTYKSPNGRTMYESSAAVFLADPKHDIATGTVGDEWIVEFAFSWGDGEVDEQRCKSRTTWIRF